MPYEITPNDIHFAKCQYGNMCKRMPDWADKEAIEGAALLGLVQAAHSFDPDRCERHTVFTSFAYTRIWGAMMDELRSQDHLTRWHRDQINHGEIDDVPAATSLNTDMSSHFVGAAGRSDPEPLTLLEMIASKDEDPLDICTRKDSVRQATLKLSDRERLVIVLFANDFSGREIGDILGVSESRVSQIRSKISRKVAA